jgi:hypothetical protein
MVYGLVDAITAPFNRTTSAPDLVRPCS